MSSSFPDRAPARLDATWSASHAAAEPLSALRIDPSVVLKQLALVIAILGLLHLAATPIYIYGPSADAGIHVKAARFFMLQNEKSLPTWFSTVLIAFNAILLWLNATAARQRTSGAIPWLALAVIFAFLSMDEMLVLHERVGTALGRHFRLGGWLNFPWIIAGSIFSAVVAVAFTGFLRRLPRRTARLFILSGAVYVGGALGVEGIESVTTGTIGFGLLYHLEVLVEEVMEMFGQALFAYALLDHLARQGAGLILAAGPADARRAAVGSR